MCSGNVGRQALHLDVAGDEVEDAALQLDAARLALEHDRHGDGDRLVHRQLIEVGVQQLVRDRIELVSFTITRASLPSSSG